MKNRIGKITVAVLLGMLVLVASLTIYQTVKAEPLDTYHSSWHLVRETADEDGSDFLATYNLPIQGNFANKDSATVINGGPFQIPSKRAEIGDEGRSPGSKWMFAMCAKNYDVANDNIVDNTFSYNIVGWGKTNGMIQIIAEGDCVLGTQAVIVYPDGGDAVGALISETGVTYNHSAESYTDTSDTGSFDGAAVGMMAYVTGTDLTDGYYAITTVTDANIIVMSGMASTDNNTDSTVQINPSFWADTINLDETTKWPRDGDANNVMVYNSGDNEVAFIVVETTGLEWVQFVIYGADAATGIEAGDVTVYGRRW